MPAYGGPRPGSDDGGMNSAARTRAAVIALLVALTAATGCSSDAPSDPWGASTARIGESLAVLGWNMSVTNLRWESDHVLVDIDAAPADPDAPHAIPEDIRFGLYGALAHPLEADGLGSCAGLATPGLQPLSAPNPDRLTGTVCLGALSEQSAVRGVYVYSPRDRIPNTVAAYPAAFPVGLLPTNENDNGLVVSTTSVEAWNADGTQLSQASLGDPVVFSGNGYMLLGLRIAGLAQRYRDESDDRGGPLMIVVAPTLPGEGLTPACSEYGASVLVLPDAKFDSVRVDASLCTQGEINAAVLAATVSVIGTHAAVWTSRE